MRRKSDSIKQEPEDGGGHTPPSGLSLTIAKFNSSMTSNDLKSRGSNMKSGQQQQQQLQQQRSSSSGKEETMLPFVSITPIGKGDAQVAKIVTHNYLLVPVPPKYFFRVFNFS